MGKKIFPTVFIKKQSLRNGKQRTLFFFVHSGKSELGGRTLKWEWAVNKWGCGGVRTVGPIPLHSPLMFDLLVLSANIGNRKEKPS